MRKIIIPLAAFALLASSCGNSGNKAETKEAETVIETTAEAASSYSQFDKNSFLKWRGSHLGGLQPRFGKVFLKQVDIKTDGEKLLNAKAIVDMNSISVENFSEDEAEMKQKLTGHLASADFFKVDSFPTAVFELTKYAKNEGEYNALISGNLKIMDVTKSITFKANIQINDAEVTVNSEPFIVDRRDWNLTYNVEGTEGVPVDYLISNDLEFEINLIAKKPKM